MTQTAIRRLFYVFPVAILVLSVIVAAQPDRGLPQGKADHPLRKEFNPDGSLRRITGKAKVINAHTLVFEDGTEVELNGTMYAPEMEQKALIGDSFYPCGKEAAQFLKRLIGDQKVTFLAFGSKSSEYGDKPFGNCYAGETFIQEAMVRNGWAVADHSAMDLAQLIAQEKKRGLWRGKFIMPGKWRKGERLPGE